MSHHDYSEIPKAMSSQLDIAHDIGESIAVYRFPELSKDVEDAPADKSPPHISSQVTASQALLSDRSISERCQFVRFIDGF